MLRLTPCQRGRCFYWCLMEHGSCDTPSGVSGGNGDNYRAGGGIQRGTGVPLCVVVGGGFLRGRGSRNTLPLKRVFGYFLHEQKVTRGVGLEAPSGFGKKHVSFPPPGDRRISPASARCAGTEASKKMGSGGETPETVRSAASAANLTKYPPDQGTCTPRWRCAPSAPGGCPPAAARTSGRWPPRPRA